MDADDRLTAAEIAEMRSLFAVLGMTWVSRPGDEIASDFVADPGPGQPLLESDVRVQSFASIRQPKRRESETPAPAPGEKVL
jgi:hypothetical protein